MGIQLGEVDDLDFIYYLQIRRDAFITELDKTQGGQEYLRNAWLMSRTEPDRESARRVFGIGRGGAAHGG